MISVCQVEIYIYESNCLKDKRRILKSIIDRLKSKYNITIAETDYNEKWNRSVITFAAVSNSGKFSDKVIYKVLRIIENDDRIEVTKNELYRC
ncbi:MAG: DUF503 domain-containing protein [Eubacteriales bacterium]